MLSRSSPREEKNRNVAASDGKEKRNRSEEQVHRLLEIAGVGVRQTAYADRELLGEDVRCLVIEFLVQGPEFFLAVEKLTPGFSLISGPYRWS